MNEQLEFLLEFVKDPIHTGAIAPSSKYLARFIVKQANVSAAKRIVEIGPGTGSFTTEILKSKTKSSKFFAIEINKQFVRDLKQKYPDISVYEQSADSLSSLIKKEGWKNADCIVSGLPWAIFSDAEQDNLLDAITYSLAPEGLFVTFAYVQGRFLPAGFRFRNKVFEKFKRVDITESVLLNLPPAFLYVCKK